MAQARVLPAAPGSLQSSRRGATWARRVGWDMPVAGQPGQAEGAGKGPALPSCSLCRDAQGVYQLATLLMELDPEDEASRLLAADALYCLGRLDDAHKALLVALSRRPQAAPVLVRLALLQLRRGFFYDADQVRSRDHGGAGENGPRAAGGITPHGPRSGPRSWDSGAGGACPSPSSAASGRSRSFLTLRFLLRVLVLLWKWAGAGAWGPAGLQHAVGAPCLLSLRHEEKGPRASAGAAVFQSPGQVRLGCDPAPASLLLSPAALLPPRRNSRPRRQAPPGVRRLPVGTESGAVFRGRCRPLGQGLRGHPSASSVPSGLVWVSGLPALGHTGGREGCFGICRQPAASSQQGQRQVSLGWSHSERQGHVHPGSGSVQSRHWSQGFCSMPSAGLPGPSVTL